MRLPAIPARVWVWAARALPRELVYWACLRVLNDVQESLPDTRIARRLAAPALSFRHALERWK